MTKAEATVRAAIEDILRSKFSQHGKHPIRIEELIDAVVDRIRNGPERWAFVALTMGWMCHDEPAPDFATAMNTLTPEQIAKGMETLPTEALEWGVRFEAMRHPTDEEKRGTLPDQPPAAKE